MKSMNKGEQKNPLNERVELIAGEMPLTAKMKQYSQLMVG